MNVISWLEGELSRLEREPPNVQITISEDGVITLNDEEGEFLTIDEPYEHAGSTEPDEEGALTGANEEGTSADSYYGTLSVESCVDMKNY